MFNFRRTLTLLVAVAAAGISLSAQVFQNSQLTVTQLKDHEVHSAYSAKDVAMLPVGSVH